MIFCCLIFVLIYSHTIKGQVMDSSDSKLDTETRRIDMIVDLVTFNFKNNGWSTILCFGILPDDFYNKLQNISHTFAVTDLDREDEDIEDVVRYYANTIVVSLQDIEQYEDLLQRVTSSPYWHPHSNVILYYHQQDREILPQLFFSLWYHKAINSIIIQYDDAQEMLLISQYSPYISNYHRYDSVYGCWTTRKIGMPISSFEDGFTCQRECHKVSFYTKLKAKNLGTCLGISGIAIPYNNSRILSTLDLFEDKAKNLYGYTFSAYVTELKPFLLIDDNGDGRYALRGRDGLVWNSMMKLMNFTIDLTPSINIMKENFDFELNIKQIYDFSLRKADLYLGPVYLFDLVIVQVDYSAPFKGSGVCIMAHRAGFESTLFNVKGIQANVSVVIQGVVAFVCIWIIFSVYKGTEKGHLSFDQSGKDLLNALRNILLITLLNPPRRQSFRVFLSISIWGFFVINFAAQAAIISFLTAVKRGKEVETFEDVIEKGYLIYGMASPDLILPETEERFRIINSRLVSVQDLFGCVTNFTYDVYRFCLIDCAVGRYLELNRLNEQGEQYLHIAQDRMHSHYLTFLLMKHSPLTPHFDKNLMRFFEAGLIGKWEQYRFNDIKEEAPTRPLGINDFASVFNSYCVAVGIICAIFIMELLIFNVKQILIKCMVKKNKSRYD